MAIWASTAIAGDYLRVSGPQARSRLSGRVLTDRVHWRFELLPGGRLRTVSLGRRAGGAWRVEKGLVCLTPPAEETTCYALWLAGSAARLEADGMTPLEGFLERP